MESCNGAACFLVLFSYLARLNYPIPTLLLTQDKLPSLKWPKLSNSSVTTEIVFQVLIMHITRKGDTHTQPFTWEETALGVLVTRTNSLG